MENHPYTGENDLRKLIDFLTQMRQRNPVQRWHIGDLIWRMFYSSQFDPTRNVHLWEAGGKVIGFGWRYPPNGAELYPRDPSLLPEMLDWAKWDVPEGQLYLATLDTDRNQIAYLEAQGYQSQPAYGFHLHRSLDGIIPTSTLPEGFVIRPINDDEIETRAILHQQAFGTLNVTVEGYYNVTYAPIYERDLDLVAVAPDGRLAAFALCWRDQVNQVGLFEPVGTHPDFRRLGLARAVMLEGMRRMQAGRCAPS